MPSQTHLEPRALMRVGYRQALFCVETLLFALPSFFFYVSFGVPLALVGLWKTLFGWLRPMFGPVEASGSFPRAAASLSGLLLPAITLLGLAAIVAFIIVAASYLKGGPAGALRRKWTFYVGALLAAAPLSLMSYIWLAGGMGFDVGLVISGLTILVPSLHLWLEIVNAERKPVLLPAS